MCGIALLLEKFNRSLENLPSSDFADLWELLCSTCAARGEVTRKFEQIYTIQSDVKYRETELDYRA